MKKKQSNFIQKIGMGILIPVVFLVSIFLGDSKMFKDLILESYGVKAKVK